MRDRPKRPDASNRNMRLGAFLIYAALIGTEAPCQSPNSVGRGGVVALEQAVKDANNDLHVAIVASHPDDRYVLPAAHLRFLRGCRVSIILFTRGAGGQNSRGPEVGDALGRIRTEETEDCARRLGAKVWYLNREDGGFCRTAQEALDLWGRDSTIEDLAKLLRKIKPDIVLTTHDPEETHGHDLGLLEVLQPAVQLAGNPTFVTLGAASIRRPYLFRGARKSGARESGDKTILPMDVTDISRGETIRAIAYQALTEAHRSQAPFKPIEKLFAPEIALIDLQTGGRESLSLTQAFGKTRTLFDELTPVLDSSCRSQLRDQLESLPGLLNNRRKLVETAIKLRRDLRDIPRTANSDLDRRIHRRLEAIDRIILHGLNLQASIKLDPRATAVAGEDLPFSLTVHNGPLARVEALELRVLHGGTLRGSTSAAPELTKSQLETDETWQTHLKLSVASDINRHLDKLYAGDTLQRPIQLAFRFKVNLGASESGGGEVLEFPIALLVRVCDPIELEVNPTSLFILDGQESVTFSVRIRRNTQKPIDGRIRVVVPAGVRANPSSRPVQMSDAWVRDHKFELKVKDLRPSTTPLYVRLDNAEVRVSVCRVAAEIPTGLRVGMIRGVDDTTYHLLRSMEGAGLELVLLNEAELPTRDLSDLDTIVIGIRALCHNEAARASIDRLLQFAEGGGRLLVFYHKDAEFNVETSGFRAYPRGLSMTIGKGRVTHHDAPVEILLPEHPLLTWPNMILKSDWDGWAQERGLYFPTGYGDGFEELLSMADPGQPKERGSLLYSRVGQGEYVYCALSLYRQFKNNLHPGACRLFANLIARKRPNDR